MAADGHRELRELLGSYALGALDPDESARVGAHLEGCAECRSLVAELGAVAAALPAADPERVGGPAVETADVEPLLARIAAERRAERRRRRSTAIGGSIAAVAAVAAIAIALPLGTGDDGPATPAPPAGAERDLRSLRTGVTGSVELADRFWGTQLTLRATGLPARRRASVWLERRDGRRVPAGTIYGLGDEPLRAQLAAGLRVRDARAVGVSDSTGRVVLSAPTGG